MLLKPSSVFTGKHLPDPGRSRLSAFSSFGSNPGDLDAQIHVPAEVAEHAPVVVVLHGCTQNAAGYDRSSAWSKAADHYGFIALFPVQRRTNNPNLCFNWFSPKDARRGRGEALSIAQMVDAVHARHNTDPTRVFITGLSAGGAMSAVMLAAYPDIFAGGAVIAGLPFAVANNVPQALERMRGQGLPAARKLGELVRSASRHTGPMPTISVWHGSADATVDPSNARALVDQWRELHGVTEKPTIADLVNGHRHKVWCDVTGRQIIEEYLIEGLGHGTPLSTLDRSTGEIAGPHMLEAGISSTRQILQFWGLATENAVRAATMQTPPARASFDDASTRVEVRPHAKDAIKDVIERALRSAGLMN